MLLVKWISPHIVRWCARFQLNRADTEDVSQSVFQKVWVSFAKFRKDKPGDSFRGWVYTITRHECVDFLKRRASNSVLQDKLLPIEPIPADDTDLRQSAIRLVLEQIVEENANDVTFKAFYRSAVDGLSSTEVAVELNLQSCTVRKHKSRWIKKLRERLQIEFRDLLD